MIMTAQVELTDAIEPQLESRLSVAAMNDFLKRIQKPAYRMAKLSTRNTEDALDIVQDAMLKLLQKYPDKPERELKPLFYRILTTKLTDWHRKRNFRNQFHWFFSDEQENDKPLENLASDFNQSPEYLLENEQDMISILQGLMALSERQRQVFILRQWQGFSVEETAAIMNCSSGSVKTHLHRANQAMQAWVGNHDE
jgi:RNA polymerase sigma-70 factor (ECF subfamily)